MANLAEKVNSPADWDIVVPIPHEVEACLAVSLGRILPNSWIALPKWSRNLPSRAVGVSDASAISLAWAFHSQRSMSMVITKNPISDQPIFFAEQRAVMAGCKMLLSELEGETAAEWRCDNMGAVYVSNKGLSKFSAVNEDLQTLFKIKVRKGVRVTVVYVPSEENLVDGASRRPVKRYRSWKREACEEHPGQWCPHFVDWVKRLSEEMRAHPSE